MSTKKKSLFAEAMADAADIKKTALTNAKLAIEEAFTPKLKKMISDKLSEGLEEEYGSSEEMEEKKKDKSAEEGGYTKKASGEEKPLDSEHESGDDFGAPVKEAKKKSSEEKSSEEVDEFDLSALLKELEAESGEEGADLDTAVEAKKKSSEEGGDSDEEPASDDDIKYEEYLKLKDRFEPPAKKAAGSESGEEEMDESGEIDLESLLKELEKGSEEKSSEMDEKKSKSAEEGGYTKKASGEDRPMDGGKFGSDDVKEGIGGGLKALVDKLKAGASNVFDDFKRDFEAIKDPKQRAEWIQSFADAFGNSAGMEEVSKLKTELNEVNLLNAKLVWFGKIVKENDDITRTDKVSYLKQFDKASNVNEVKLIYGSISEALKSSAVKQQKSKKSMKEGLGFASKASGTSKKMISENKEEADDIVETLSARWQRLAGINKD